MFIRSPFKRPIHRKIKAGSMVLNTPDACVLEDLNAPGLDIIDIAISTVFLADPIVIDRAVTKLALNLTAMSFRRSASPV